MANKLTPPDYDSVIEPEWHSVINFSLGELYADGWFDLANESWDFPKYTDEQHKRLCDKILNHYYSRDIGILPLAAWKREFLRKMNEVMPKYIILYKKIDEQNGNYNATDEYYKSRNVVSDFPQTQLSGNEDYASTGVDHQYERIHEGTVLDLAEKLKTYEDVDLQIVNELDSLFSCLFTVNMNAW